jgi:hypothetical protein
VVGVGARVCVVGDEVVEVVVPARGEHVRYSIRLLDIFV